MFTKENSGRKDLFYKVAMKEGVVDKDRRKASANMLPLLFLLLHLGSQTPDFSFLYSGQVLSTSIIL